MKTDVKLYVHLSACYTALPHTCTCSCSQALQKRVPCHAIAEPVLLVLTICVCCLLLTLVPVTVDRPSSCLHGLWFAQPCCAAVMLL